MFRFIIRIIRIGRVARVRRRVGTSRFVIALGLGRRLALLGLDWFLPGLAVVAAAAGAQVGFSLSRFF